MKEAEKEYIRTRFYDLCKNTKCGADLLNFLYSKKALSLDEMELIATERTTNAKSQKLYEIIQIKSNAFELLLQGLKKTEQSGALQVLLEPKESDESVLMEVQKFVKRMLRDMLPTPLSSCTLSEKGFKTNIKFDVLPPVQCFAGRQSELEQLHKMILRSEKEERAAVVSQVTPVSGLGGIGKTQLAREYVRLYEQEFKGNVLWMHAESEASLTESFKKLAKEKLNLSTTDMNGKNIPAKSIAEAVYKYFDGGKVLFVLDNAENAVWLKQFMPKISQPPGVFILITSRDREWDRRMEVLQLDGLTKEDAIKLIQKELSIDKSDVIQMEDIRKLAQTLQYFPLAIQQAIAYVYEQQTTLNYSIQDYLKEFESKQYQLLGFREEGQLCEDSFTTTTATTWSITVDKINDDLNCGELASLILNVVAYLKADNIKRELFYLIPEVSVDAQFSSVDQKQVNAAVRLLVKYSMINGRENQSILSVHRLVQSVTRNKLSQDGTDVHFLELAIQLLQGSDEIDLPAENIGHSLIVWEQAFSLID